MFAEIKKKNTKSLKRRIFIELQGLLITTMSNMRVSGTRVYKRGSVRIACRLICIFGGVFDGVFLFFFYFLPLRRTIWLLTKRVKHIHLSRSVLFFNLILISDICRLTYISKEAVFIVREEGIPSKVTYIECEDLGGLTCPS